MVACVGTSFVPQRGLRCCTKALEHADDFSSSSRLTCKSPQKGSGPEGTRTPGLRHARAPRRFAGVFRCVQNACKWQHSDESTFSSISGDLPGLLHGCCTDGKACMRARSGM